MNMKITNRNTNTQYHSCENKLEAEDNVLHNNTATQKHSKTSSSLEPRTANATKRNKNTKTRKTRSKNTKTRKNHAKTRKNTQKHKTTQKHTNAPPQPQTSKS